MSPAGLLALATPLALVSGAEALSAQEVAERAVDPESGHTYVRTPEPLHFLDAEALAQALGGTLVAIDSAAEELFLLENFGAEPYWIGLEFPRESWASGAPVTFTHWASGEPDGAMDQPYTLLNWSDPGSWGDTDGDVESVRCRALVEFPRGKAAGANLALPVTRPAQRGVLLVAIQDLVGKDLENPRNASLFGLWKGSAWTHEASGDGSGDPLASLGMVLWGVGSPRSRLTSANPKGAARDRNSDLLARLERTHPSITTAALLDDPALAGVLLGGRTDVRTSNASARKGGSGAPVADALARPTPACVFATFTNLVAPGTAPRSEGERAKDIAAIDRELGALLTTLRARPTFAEEEWLIVLCGLTRQASKGNRDAPQDEPTSVPLVLVGSPLPAGEFLGQVSLVDLPPLALAHLGIATRQSWVLDGLVPGRPAILGADLVVNGGAEAQFGWPNGQFPLISGWRTRSDMHSARHDGASGGPPSRGQSYFQGGKGSAAGLDQRIDLRALASEIEKGSLRYRLSGWLGAGAAPVVTVEAYLEFWSEQKKTLERVPLGLLESGKRPKDSPPAGLVEFQASGRVPKRTRAARLVLSASGPESCAGAMADEFALVLERD